MKSLDMKDIEPERMEWGRATLPQPMTPDCEVVHGKVKGPKNIVFCKTHGHVMDTDLGMVIAHTIEEFEAGHS
jgi:hypothetical protein